LLSGFPVTNCTSVVTKGGAEGGTEDDAEDDAEDDGEGGTEGKDEDGTEGKDDAEGGTEDDGDAEDEDEDDDEDEDEDAEGGTEGDCSINLSTPSTAPSLAVVILARSYRAIFAIVRISFSLDVINFSPVISREYISIVSVLAVDVTMNPYLFVS